MEPPRATKDIFGDDSCQVRLDAQEFLSEVGVLDFRQAFGPLLEMSWQRKLLLVPYERPHVMEGVVGILLTARRLLDAGELFYASEHVRAVPNYFLLEGASGFVVAREDLIENFIDIRVVFVRLTVRVQIRGIGIFGLRAMSTHFVSSLHTTRMLEGKERPKSKQPS